MNIEDMKIRLPELQDDNKAAKKLRSKRLPKGLEDIKQVLYHQGFLYIPKVIYSELINKHHKDLFIGYFGIEKTQKLIVTKYYWPTL